jgi:hypothetical protein
MRRWFLATGVVGVLAFSVPAWAQWQNNNLAVRTTGSVLRSGDALRVELVAFETVNGPFSTQVTYRFRQPVTVKDEEGHVTTSMEQRVVTRPPGPTIDVLSESQSVVLDDTFHLGQESTPGRYLVEVTILAPGRASVLSTIRSCVAYQNDGPVSDACGFAVTGIKRVNADGWLTLDGTFPDGGAYRAALVRDGRVIARLDGGVYATAPHEMDLTSTAFVSLAGQTLDLIVHDYRSNQSATLARLAVPPRQ